jgi:hypothetical protein
MRASIDCLLELTKREFDCEPGLIATLHTWGQRLNRKPIHHRHPVMEVVMRASSVIYQLSSRFVSLSRVRLSVGCDEEKEALREQNLLLVTGHAMPKSHHSAPGREPMLEIGPSLRT